jgi:hypothetical protein
LNEALQQIMNPPVHVMGSLPPFLPVSLALQSPVSTPVIQYPGEHLFMAAGARLMHSQGQLGLSFANAAQLDTGWLH